MKLKMLTNKRSFTGFTLLELLIVIAIMAMATAGVSLAMRDTTQTALEREAQRLAVLFESARAQSRASGTSVVWHATSEGFRFEGLPLGALPERWLSDGTAVNGIDTVQLGPEPIIGPQTVDLVNASPVIAASANPLLQSAQAWRVATDGLRPFTVQKVGGP